jgi:hypothetical protein
MIDDKAMAQLELERHHQQLLYAERQRVKAGAHEGAANSRVRRWRLWVLGATVSTLVGTLGVGVFGWSGAHLTCAAVLLGWCAWRYSRARRRSRRFAA